MSCGVRARPAGSYVEVCETSSVGRALALLGFEVKRGVASREEMEKAARKQPERPVPEKPAPEKPVPAKAVAAPDSAVSQTPAPPPPPSPRPTPSKSAPAEATVEQPPDDLDAQILQAAGELGYNDAKVRRWITEVRGHGRLGSLTDHDKREVLKLFREQSRADSAKTRASREQNVWKGRPP